MSKVDQRTKSLVAFALSSALNGRACAYEWAESNHDETKDVAIGNGNNWWLRTGEGGSLYVQCRYDGKDEYSAKLAIKMIEIANELNELTGIEVRFPRTFDEYCVSAGFRKAE